MDIANTSLTFERPKLSVVTTLYGSRNFIERFYSEACRVAGALNLPFEIIFVNDGSPDDSFEAAHTIQQRDSRVKLIDLSRNFGHHRALMTAFSFASGDMIYVTDVDLEEPMDFLRVCHERFLRGDCDVVFGYQKQRRGNWLTRAPGNAFSSLFNLLCNMEVQPNQVAARLMSRRYVASLLTHRESDPYMIGLWAITGYVQIALPIVKSSTGISSYTAYKRVALALNSIVSFSGRPLLLSAAIGILICFLAGIWVTFLIGRWLLWGNEVEGWTSVIVSVWLLGGTNLFFIGLVGLYVSRIFGQVKQRPNVIVRATYGDLKQVSPNEGSGTTTDQKLCGLP